MSRFPAPYEETRTDYLGMRKLLQQPTSVSGEGNGTSAKAAKGKAAKRRKGAGHAPPPEEAAAQLDTAQRKKLTRIMLALKVCAHVHVCTRTTWAQRTRASG